MKRQRLIALLSATLLAALGITACQKTKYVAPPASFTVVHAMADESNPIVPLFGAKQSGQYFAAMQPIYYGSSFLFSPVAGVSNIQIVPSSDTMFNIVKWNMTLVSGNIYTLFLAGDTTHPDTVLTVDKNIPYHADSSTGIRFINLVPDSKPMLVNLMGNDPTKNDEFTNLAYKQITAFKSYSGSANSVGAVNGGMYTFEIRDQATDSLLNTYNWYYPLFQNQTIVIAGAMATGGPGITVFPVNNY